MFDGNNHSLQFGKQCVNLLDYPKVHSLSPYAISIVCVQYSITPFPRSLTLLLILVVLVLVHGKCVFKWYVKLVRHRNSTGLQRENVRSRQLSVLSGGPTE